MSVSHKLLPASLALYDARAYNGLPVNMVPCVAVSCFIAVLQSSLNVSDFVVFLRSVRDTTKCDMIADITVSIRYVSVSPDRYGSD